MITILDDWMVDSMENTLNTLIMSSFLSDFYNKHYTIVRLRIVWKAKHITHISFKGYESGASQLFVLEQQQHNWKCVDNSEEPPNV